MNVMYCVSVGLSYCCWRHSTNDRWTLVQAICCFPQWQAKSLFIHINSDHRTFDCVFDFSCTKNAMHINNTFIYPIFIFIYLIILYGIYIKMNWITPMSSHSTFPFLHLISIHLSKRIRHYVAHTHRCNRDFGIVPRRVVYHISYSCPIYITKHIKVISFCFCLSNYLFVACRGFHLFSFYIQP